MQGTKVQDSEFCPLLGKKRPSSSIPRSGVLAIGKKLNPKFTPYDHPIRKSALKTSFSIAHILPKSLDK
jgi:hypothetical protein